jgi:hypothetical protein
MDATCVPCFDTIVLAEAMAEQNIDFGLVQHFLQHLLPDVGLVIPAERLRVSRQIVFLTNPPIEFERIAADDLLLSEICARKSSRGHAAQVLSRLEQGNLQTFAASGNRCHYTPGRATVHNQIVIGLLTGQARQKRQNS